MFFDLRISSEQEEQLGREPRGAVELTRDTEVHVHLEIVDAIRGAGGGRFYWTVFVVRDADPPQIVSVQGEKRTFYYRPTSTPSNTPRPTKTPEPEPTPKTP